jgi:methionine synthase II (cobalamin-independent)
MRSNDSWRAGTIAGNYSHVSEPLARETVSSLKDRLEEAMAVFTRHGVPFRQLVRQGLLTPSCGLATLRTGQAAETALELLAGLSDSMRRRYL